MRTMRDGWAKRRNMRIIRGPNRNTLVAGREYELWCLVQRYPGADYNQLRVECKPVPRPDYEAEYGGPYSYIVTVWYNSQCAAVFGLTTGGDFVLWMD